MRLNNILNIRQLSVASVTVDSVMHNNNRLTVS